MICEHTLAEAISSNRPCSFWGWVPVPIPINQGNSASLGWALWTLLGSPALFRADHGRQLWSWPALLLWMGQAAAPVTATAASPPPHTLECKHSQVTGGACRDGAVGGREGPRHSTTAAPGGFCAAVP